jgi:hypothetical protein
MVREGMRGADQQQNHIFSYVSPEERVRKDHPPRIIRTMMDEVFQQLSRRLDSMSPRLGDRRFRRNNCCERNCCKCCTRFAANGC